MKNVFKVAFLLAIMVMTKGQSQDYQINNDLSTLEVNGTSTIHDWTIVAETQSGKLSFNNSEEMLLTALELNIEAQSLKSGKSGMDKNTYKALKAKEYDFVKFNLIQVNSVEQKDEQTYVLTCLGNLEVAGVTQKINLELLLQLTDTSIEIEGKKDLLMTDFNIDPPTAVFGTIKTGNELLIKFKTIFNN